MFIYFKRYFQSFSIVHLLYVLTAYLVFNTGAFSDDFLLAENKNMSIYATAPLLIIVREVFFNLLTSNHYMIYEAIKTIYVLLALYMINSFFSQLHNKETAAIISFAFVFFPVHDATTFFLTGQYLFWSLALCMYACSHALRNNYKFATIFSFMGSFISWGSTPFSLGLALFCYLKKDRKAALVLLIPNLIFIVYYLIVTKIIGVGISRIPDQTSLIQLAKQFLLQGSTAADSLIGPSMWLKVYYSITNISMSSIIISIIILSFIFARYTHHNTDKDKSISKSFFLIFLLSLGMFTVTGRYPQIAFNLGDRVTIYGSLLIIYLLFTLPNKHIIKYALLPIMVLSSLGISDHWKQWHQHQQTVIENIRTNEKLKALPKSTTVFISGNQYSKLGALDHIEFLSENFVASSIFHYAQDHDTGHIIRTLNSRMEYDNSSIKDDKHKTSYDIKDEIYIYDSENNKLLIVKNDDIKNYLQALPKNKRHWVQLIGDGFIKDSILYLMPRLKYAFP